ncbi:hypothetical protein ACFQE1_01700 [Halobium palmae]|uniref:Uncharacterized protein n=1 Tax=Halobium palmae TaxID=1776492 RepID=A0ABD5RV81_9EURY
MASNSGILDFVGENYDFGDLLAGMVGSFGIASLTGISESSAYGVSFTDTAFSIGGEAVSIAAFSVVIATLVSFITNGGLTVQSVMNRPVWEKTAVASLVSIPVLTTVNLFGIHGLITESYVNGTIAAAIMLVGFLIVAFRRANSAQKGLFERVRT